MDPSRPTGDVTNALGKLHKEISKDPFRKSLPEGKTPGAAIKDLGKGIDPVPILKLLHTCALSASTEVANFLLGSAVHPLSQATDRGFVPEL